MARRILPALAVLALVLTAQAMPAVHHTGTLSEIPTDLHAFLLRANEPVEPYVLADPPAFTWKSVKLTGGHYQFQLSTSRNFEDATLVFKDANVSQPAETVTRQLPWMTGEPYALWARVRWIRERRRKCHPLEQAFRVQRPLGDRRRSSADPCA